MNGDDDSPVLDVVTRRYRLLSRLSTKPARKSDVAADLDVARSTVDRGLAELEGVDLVDTAEGAERLYRTTLSGELALEEFERYAESVDDVLASTSLLSRLPGTARIDSSALEGADIRLTDGAGNDDALAALATRIERADSVRAFLGTIPSPLVDAYGSAIDDGLEAALAVTSDTLTTVLADHRDALGNALSTGRLDVRVTAAPLPFGLCVFRTGDGPVAATIVRDDGRVAGVIETTAPDGVAWAERRLEDVWTAATPLSLPDPGPDSGDDRSGPPVEESTGDSTTVGTRPDGVGDGDENDD